MTRRFAPCALLVGAGVLTYKAAGGIAFLSALGQRARRPAPLYGDVSEPAAPALNRLDDAAGGSAHWSFAGLAIVAAATASGIKPRGKRDSSTVGRRYKPFARWVPMLFDVDEEEETKTWKESPTWLTPGSEDNKKFAPIPDWLTAERWRSYPRSLKMRSPDYISRLVDATGTPTLVNKKPLPLEQAYDLLASAMTKEPGKSTHTPTRPIQLFLKLNLDPKYPDQQLRCKLTAPHPVGGAAKRIAVFCDETEAAEVLELGAVSAGEKLAKDIAEENIEFDILLAKAAQMPKLAKLGRILGPLKLMPSPKTGSVIKDFKEGIEEFSSGRSLSIVGMTQEFTKGDARPLTFCCLQVGSFMDGRQKNMENIRAVLQGIADNAPTGSPEDLYQEIKLTILQGFSIPIDPIDYPKFDKKRGQ